MEENWYADVQYGSIFELFDSLWNSISGLSRIIRVCLIKLGDLFFDVSEEYINQMLKEADFPKDCLSLFAEILYLLINLGLFILTLRTYENASSPQNSNFFLSRFLGVTLGCLFPYLGITIYKWLDAIEVAHALKLIIPIVIFGISVIMLVKFAKDVLSEKGIVVFLLMILTALISQGSILILAPWFVVSLLSCIWFVLMIIICSIFILPLISSSPGGNESPSPKKSVRPKNRWVQDREGVYYWIGEDDNFVQEERGGNRHRYHENDDGEVYLDDNRMKHETSDERLY